MEIYTKLCTKCKKWKNSVEFNQFSRSKDGLYPSCKDCRKASYRVAYKKDPKKFIQKSKNWKEANKIAVKAIQKRYAENHPNKVKERFKTWRMHNLEYDKIRLKKWRDLNKDQINRYNRMWIENNRGYKNFHGAKRRAEIEQRIPKWADLDKIKKIYKNRPDGYHVDHIIPLKGNNVSGLHVEYNLQYLTTKENLQKSNKFSK